MFGQQRYKLPGSKKRNAEVEPEQPIEVDGPLADESADFETSYPSETNYEDDDYYEDDGYEYNAAEEDDDYYFEEQQEPVKSAPAPIVEFVSNRADIPTLEALSTTTVIEEVPEPKVVDDGETREYHPRDESVPFDSPPGYVWASEKGLTMPFWCRRHFLNALGIGDASLRYNWTDEIEPQVPYAPGMGTNELPTVHYYDQIDPKERPESTSSGGADPPIYGKVGVSDGDEEDDGLPKEFLIKELETMEPDQGSAGIWFWNGPRWQHWWYGYESPTSITGYPIQWFYRATHFFFPDTYEDFPYDKHSGEIDFRESGKTLWWLVSHPCIPTILVNFAVIFPFAYFRQLRMRSKIIRNRIATGRSLFKTLDEHIPIMLRRIRFRAIRKRRQRWYDSSFAGISLLLHFHHNSTHFYFPYAYNYTNGCFLIHLGFVGWHSSRSPLPQVAGISSVTKSTILPTIGGKSTTLTTILMESRPRVAI